MKSDNQADAFSFRARRASRNPGLDIARATAIAIVVLSHMFLPDHTSQQATIALLWSGEMAVELFFSLSGFLIGSILIDMAQTAVTPRAVGAFLFRRWMRTLPVYYVGLWILGQYADIQNIHAYFFLQNFHVSEPRSMVVSWSLVMEEYFYFVFPFAMLFFAAVFGRRVRLVALVGIALCVICTVVRLANTYGHEFMPIPWMHQNPLMRLDCASYGVLAVCLLRGRPEIVRWLSASRCFWLLAISILLLALWSALFALIQRASVDTLVAWGFVWWGPAYFAVQHSVLDLTFAITVAALFLLPLRMPFWLGWCVRQLSLLSYSAYIFHVVILDAMERYMPGKLGMAKFPLAAAAILTIAALSYYGLERPLLRVRDWIVPARGARRFAASKA